MTRILFWVVFSGLAQAACLAVSGSRIVAGDLRDTAPFLQALDPATPVGFAPLPGAQRILSARELRQFAQRYGIQHIVEPAASVCVERATHIISGDEIKEAMLAALGFPDAELDLIEFSRQRAPNGRLEFRASGLNRPPRHAPDTPVIWRGRLIYDGQSSLMIWARVRMSVERTVLTASEDIAAGTAIGPGQVSEVRQRRFPFGDPAPLLLAEVIGAIPRKRIPAGQEFVAAALSAPKDISSGDKVRVSVVDGAATLSLDAVAQSSGRKGQSIVVHSPATGKNFRAVVEAKGRAKVQLPPGD